MADGTEKKLFTAEIQRMKAKGLPAGTYEAPSLEPVLGAIAALHQDVRALDEMMRGLATVVSVPPPPPPPASDSEEIAELKAEIRAMGDCIERTKIEIAALRPVDEADDRLTAVTNELDAIVTATESATQGILEAAEKVDDLARELQSQSPDGDAARIAGAISNAVVRIFEESNFQDITGQRISKVVKTLQFIEERVNRMIAIWGQEAFENLPLPEEVKDEDEKLLNGPALANQGISQDDIDKLFD